MACSVWPPKLLVTARSFPRWISGCCAGHQGSRVSLQHRDQELVLLLVGHVVPSFQISEGDFEFLHLAIPTSKGGASREHLVTLVKEVEQMDSFLSSGGVVGWCSAF